MENEPWHEKICVQSLTQMFDPHYLHVTYISYMLQLRLQVQIFSHVAFRYYKICGSVDKEPGF